MKKLIWTPHFIKSAEKFTRNFPESIDTFKVKIKLMEENIFNPSLKTHKLKGKLSGFYACSVSYNHRIVFRLDNNKI
jgi:addiction module RelE/StbE family toxin